MLGSLVFQMSDFVFDQVLMFLEKKKKKAFNIFVSAAESVFVVVLDIHVPSNVYS